MQDFWQTGFDDAGQLAFESVDLVSKGINFALKGIKLDLKNIFSDSEIVRLFMRNIKNIGKRVNLLGEFLRARPIFNFPTLTRRLR